MFSPFTIAPPEDTWLDGDPLRDDDGDGVPWVNDCDDNAIGRNYLAQEGCTGVDDDCDGLIDDDDPSRVGGLTWYLDADGDGLGDPTVPVLACIAPTGFVEGLDCDDTSAQEPHAVFVDADLDGYGSSEALPKECGPPAAGTSLDDQDCDDDDNSVTTPVPRYVDADGDGFGGASAPDACPNDAPGTVTRAGDCDDSRSDVNPDSAEVCDGVDQDCDGDIDEGVGWTTYTDEDGDGFNDLAPDADGDGIPNGLDPDYVKPEDGSGFQYGWGQTDELFGHFGEGAGDGVGDGNMNQYGPGDGTGTAGPNEDGTGFGPGEGSGDGDGDGPADDREGRGGQGSGSGGKQ